MSLGPSKRLSSVTGRQSWSRYFSLLWALSERASAKRSRGVPWRAASSKIVSKSANVGKKMACWSAGMTLARGSRAGFLSPSSSCHSISAMVMPVMFFTGMVAFASGERRSSRSNCRFSLRARPPEKRSRVSSKFPREGRLGRLLGFAALVTFASSLRIAAALESAWCLNHAAPGMPRASNCS